MLNATRRRRGKRKSGPVWDVFEEITEFDSPNIVSRRLRTGHTCLRYPGPPRRKAKLNLTQLGLFV